jgi:hypothetical protein
MSDAQRFLRVSTRVYHSMKAVTVLSMPEVINSFSLFESIDETESVVVSFLCVLELGGNCLVSRSCVKMKAFPRNLRKLTSIK